MTEAPDPEALLVALVLAPATYSRNRYFELYQQAQLRHARRRAQILRNIIKDLTEPWPHPGNLPSGFGPRGLVEEEQDGGIVLSYSVPEFQYRRSAVLTQLEAATVRYAVSRTANTPVEPEDRTRVEAALARLDPTAGA